MGEVDNQSDAIHLVNEPASGRAQPVPQRLGLAQRTFEQRGVGELVVAVVCESRVADTQGMIASEVGDRVADLMQTLDAQRGDELALLPCLQSGAAVCAGGEVFGIGVLNAGHEINLVESPLDAYGHKC